jgi:hypothetical protein
MKAATPEFVGLDRVDDHTMLEVAMVCIFLGQIQSCPSTIVRRPALTDRLLKFDNHCRIRWKNRHLQNRPMLIGWTGQSGLIGRTVQPGGAS